MPKITNTRRQRALELLQFAQDGPSMLSEEHAERWTKRYRLWSQSWIIPRILELIPELKPERETRKNSQRLY